MHRLQFSIFLMLFLLVPGRVWGGAGFSDSGRISASTSWISDSLVIVQEIGDPLPSLCVARQDGLSNYPAERETLLEAVIAVGVDGPFIVVQREPSLHLEFTIVDASPPHRSRGEFATRDKAQAFLESHGAKLPAMRSLDDMLRLDDERSFRRTVVIYFAVFAVIGVAGALIHRWRRRRRIVNDVPLAEQ